MNDSIPQSKIAKFSRMISLSKRFLGQKLADEKVPFVIDKLIPMLCFLATIREGQKDNVDDSKLILEHNDVPRAFLPSIDEQINMLSLIRTSIFGPEIRENNQSMLDYKHYIKYHQNINTSKDMMQNCVEVAMLNL